MKKLLFKHRLLRMVNFILLRTMTITDPSNFEVFIVKFAHLLIRPYYRKFAKKLELESDDKIIDFGSGPGALSKFIIKYLDEKNGLLSCIDISERWIKICKKRLRKHSNVKFYVGMITDLEVENNLYDKIIIHFVLHDINPNLRQAIINELAKKLTKDGKIIIREPTNQNHGMSPEEIKDIMQKAGLKDYTSKSSKRCFIGTVFDGIFNK